MIIVLITQKIEQKKFIRYLFFRIYFSLAKLRDLRVIL